jgi:hypothetical protein
MILFTLVVGAVVVASDAKGEEWWDAGVEASLQRSAGRKAVWEGVLANTPTEQRKGMAYLVTDLPERDLETLAPETLAENVALAYQARGRSPGARTCRRRSFSTTSCRTSRCRNRESR